MDPREKLIHDLQNYHTTYPVEKNFLPRFQKLLTHSRAFFKDHLPGHITGSSFIVDKTRKFTLLTHHAFLNRWLQPGGHANGNEVIVDVAFREAVEETGILNFKLLQRNIFDIDIHPIPAGKNFPEHDHYDVRFIFEASMDERIILSEESHDVAWKKIEELPELTVNNASLLRMAEKLALL